MRKCFFIVNSNKDRRAGQVKTNRYFKSNYYKIAIHAIFQQMRTAIADGL